MPTTVLVPIDGSEQSYGALTYALESFQDAAITTLHVVDVGRERYEHPEYGSPEERDFDVAAEYHGQAEEVARAYGIDIETETITGVPHKTILSYVVDHNVDHVVVGSHGDAPINTPFIGRTSEAIAQRAPTSVTIVPETRTTLQAESLPGRVLVPVDGSAQAYRALEYVLTHVPEASSTVIHVADLPFEYAVEEIEGTYLEPLLEAAQERAEDVLAEAAERAADAGVEIQTETAVGSPATEIVEYATEHAFQQIVMGSFGRSRVSRFLLGSVAERVARRSPIPVTLVRDDTAGG